MSINKIDSPTAYTAGYLVGQTDYTQQNLKTEASLAMGSCIFSEPSSLHFPGFTVSLKQGSFIYYAGSTYQVQDEDTEMLLFFSGVEGENYIILSGTDTLTTDITQDKSDFAWNAAYNGMYNDDGSLLLPFYLDCDFTIGVEIFEYIDKSTLNVRVSLYDGSIAADGGSLNTGGGGIDSEGGKIQSGGAVIDTEGGNSYTNGGNFQAGGGDIDTEDGECKTGSGDFNNETGHFLPCSSPTDGSGSVPAEDYYYFPRGVYVVNSWSHGSLSLRVNSSWETISIPAVIYSNGSNARMYNSDGTYAFVLYYLKY